MRFKVGDIVRHRSTCVLLKVVDTPSRGGRFDYQALRLDGGASWPVNDKELEPVQQEGHAPKDMKQALQSGIKPDTTHVRGPTRVYIARAQEFGDFKYERANCYREAPDDVKDVDRLRGYLRACVDHAQELLDSLERHQANDPNLEDVEGTKQACYAPDKDSKVPAIAHAAASLNIAITQAVEAGLLPADPGQPWREDEKV